MVIEKPKHWTTKCYVRQMVPYSVLHSFKPKKRVIYTDSVATPLQRRTDYQSTSKQASEYSCGPYSIRKLSQDPWNTQNKFQNQLNHPTNIKISEKNNSGSLPQSAINDKLFLYQLQKHYDTPCESRKKYLQSQSDHKLYRDKNDAAKNYCSYCKIQSRFPKKKFSSRMLEKKKVLHKKIHKTVSKVLKDNSSQTENTFCPCNISNSINEICCPEYFDSLSFLKSLNPKILKVIFQAQHKNCNQDYQSSKFVDLKNLMHTSKCDSGLTKILFKNSGLHQKTNENIMYKEKIESQEYTKKSQIFFSSVATNTINNNSLFKELSLKANVLIQTSSILKKDATTSICKITSRSKTHLPKLRAQKQLKIHYVKSNITTSHENLSDLKYHNLPALKRNLRNGLIDSDRILPKEKSSFYEKSKLLISLTNILKENHLKLNDYINELKHHLTESESLERTIDNIVERTEKYPSTLSSKHSSNCQISANILRKSHSMTSIDSHMNKICSNENECEFFHFLREYANIIANRTKKPENVNPDIFNENSSNLLQRRIEMNKNMKKQHSDNLSKIEFTLSDSKTLIKKIELLVRQLKELENSAKTHLNKNDKLFLKNFKTSSEMNLNVPNASLDKNHHLTVEEIFVNPKTILQNESEQELRYVSM